MNHIYYCVSCQKFHFADSKNDIVFKQCPHCDYNFAINTNTAKESYDQMSESDKQAFKNQVKSKYTLELMRELIYQHQQLELRKKGIYYELDGCRGRSIKVCDNYCIIKTSISAGSVLTGNATDGEKTIFYHDVIGIQFKEPGLTIGYLQLETASNQMNHSNSNAFSENTFTYEFDVEKVKEIKDFIFQKVLAFKKPTNIENQCNQLKVISELFEKGLLSQDEFNRLKNNII